jgi:hypothetical protein
VEAVQPTGNESIRVCIDLKDDGTKETLESILTDEEDRVDWLETQLDCAAPFARAASSESAYATHRPVGKEGLPDDRTLRHRGR